MLLFFCCFLLLAFAQNTDDTNDINQTYWNDVACTILNHNRKITQCLQTTIENTNKSYGENIITNCSNDIASLFEYTFSNITNPDNNITLSDSYDNYMNTIKYELINVLKSLDDLLNCMIINTDKSSKLCENNFKTLTRELIILSYKSDSF